MPANRLVTAFAILIALIGSAGAETVDVQVINTEFIPQDLTIEVGDTVRWTNEQGVHNVVAQNNSFPGNGIPAAAWVYELTFNEEAVHIYRCEPHSSSDFLFGMVGSITVEKGGDPEPEDFLITFGITGSWFDPDNNGQGFSLEVVPAAKVLAAYWFTFPPQGLANDQKGELPNQMWLQGSGPIEGNTATVTFDRPVGGSFDTPGGVDRETWGTATFEFTDCENGTVTYSSSVGKGSGSFPIKRITTDVNCAGEQSGN